MLQVRCHDEGNVMRQCDHCGMQCDEMWALQEASACECERAARVERRKEKGVKISNQCEQKGLLAMRQLSCKVQQSLLGDLCTRRPPHPPVSSVPWRCATSSTVHTKECPSQQ